MIRYLSHPSVLVVAVAVLSVSILRGGPPEGYYATAEGKLGETLQAALSEIIRGHTRVAYSWEPFFVLDADPENANNVLLLYSGFSRPKTPTNVYWNREHIWPQSRGLGSTSTVAGSDLFNLKPANPGVNSSRGNLAYGYPDTAHPNYVGPGDYAEAPLASRDSRRWLPREEDRGFIARALFYMATRYRGDGGDPHLILTDDPPDGNPWGAKMGDLTTLLEWNRRHPPGAGERLRNRLIYEQFQYNRNPYIDFPDLVDAAWTSDIYLAPGTWRVQAFAFTELDDSGISGWMADPGGDGYSNLMEYAFDLNPKVPDRLHPVKTARRDQPNPILTLTFITVREADRWGLRYRVETSIDLVNWVETQSLTITAVPAGRYHVLQAVSLPVVEDARRFARVRVSFEQP